MVNYFFRPHHLLCNYCFIGEVYNKVFIDNMKHINVDLKSYPNKIIQIINISDDICSKCNYNKGETCQEESKVQSIDQKHLEVLNLKYNQQLTWSNAIDIIEKNITTVNFYNMCHTCEWYNKGICYKQLFNK